MAEPARGSTNSKKDASKEPPALPFTPRQGQFLAYIRDYTRLHRQAPSEAEIAAYFNLTPASAHGMIVTLEKRGFIEKTPHEARSIRLKAPSAAAPPLEEERSVSQPLLSQTSFQDRYPHLAFWVTEQGWIELGYDPNTGAWARAVEEGGLAWSGGHPHETVEEWLEAMEAGVKGFRERWGL
jgi:hypothetical protein